MQEVFELTKAEVFVVISSLVGIISIFWKLILAGQKKEQERLEKCEKMHKESSDEVKKMTGEFNYLKGRMDGVEALSSSVLRAINEATNSDR